MQVQTNEPVNCTCDCTVEIRMTEDGDTYESNNNTEELNNVLDESLAKRNKARAQRTEKGEDENNKNLTENLIDKPDEIENSEEGEEDQNNNDLTEDLIHSSDDTENSAEGDEENSEEGDDEKNNDQMENLKKVPNLLAYFRLPGWQTYGLNPMLAESQIK